MKRKTMLAYILTFLALIISITSLGLALKNLVTNDLFCNNFSSLMKIEKNEINAKIGSGKLAKIELTNTGFEDEYKVYSRGPEWVVVKPEKIRLENNQTSEIFTYISPPLGASGDVIVNIFTESFCQRNEENLLIHVTS